ncbi:MAG: membrane-associated protein [Nevskiales bacterium]
MIVVIYWRKYGPANLLWFSDIALLGGLPALWLENGLIASTLTVGLLLPETLWNLSYFGRLLSGRRITGLTDYMFETDRPLWLRMLSLFHVPLMPVLVWVVWRMGYDPHALPAMLLLCWIVMPVCYCFTEPVRNVNWVFGPGGEGVRTRMHPLAYLAMLMFLIFPPIYAVTHLLLLLLFA